MSGQIRKRLSENMGRMLRRLRQPETLLLLPAATLAAYWLGGERALLGLALGAPLAGVALDLLRPAETVMPPMPDGLQGLALCPQLVTLLDAALRAAPASGLQTGCLVVQFDDAALLLDRHGRAAQTEVLARCAERICSALRSGDVVARLEGGGFAVALSPQRRLDLESMIQLAARLQAAIAPPISLNAMRLYVSCSVGFCLGVAAPAAEGRALLDAAQIAADEALRNGPAAIRAFAPDMARKRADRDALRGLLENALDQGEIRAHFQPQVSTDTGDITGFEALARWHHPERGVVPPVEFLGAIEEAGLAERLGEVMLFQALTALSRWDRAGLNVPKVGINLSAAELRNPRFVEKLEWEIDRFGLEPGRLCIEILETVIASTEHDVIVRNIAAMAQLGCTIDLDDFGTGHASITNIRRFAVHRLKIDRSFVTRIDADPGQQKMVAAILSLAKQLDLDTLAEGVETAGEHAMLAQLGCRHVQGFGIARPMPFDQVQDWIARHQANHRPLPRIGTRATK
ncbi:diguanylate cyclase [Gemmobacter nanjingensis]|uniref:Diguanylate cyclase n=1 Tax=Gemmobacter nanjingensis TaxID=488454 RepID=A0ABQ3FSF1_9RHOB|nr:bifunctional diguanylate cyclase/phosphodiesterase [Gemmobacter nanjingensis]GHC38659.1 diguanylate cyclase [Gemmobacter nanjingensis]